MEITQVVTLFVILNLTHLAAWADLPSIWKHVNYFPTGGNFAVVCKLNEQSEMTIIRCAL